jgi:hypothetical protein
MEVLETINAAKKILLAIENTFNTNSVVLPSRVYITVGGQGTVAYDCEQLTISWERTYSGKPGEPIQQVGNCNNMRTGSFIIELVRPIPVSQNPDIPPETFLIQESAEGLMRDAVLLYNAGLIAAEDTLLGGLANVTVGPPSGGFQSIIMTVEMLV